MRPWGPWEHRPQPDTEADIEQAIGAKLYLALHALPLLAEAEVVLIEPPLADLVPDWKHEEDAAQYAARAQLPHSPLFLDFEDAEGLPAAWHAETWPLPLHLRGAICWQSEGLLCVIPFGSVGGVHPWGGSDYHGWSRWTFVQDERDEWPMPGRGDFIARPTGEVISWVDADDDSICAHQGALAYNLCRRTLRVLQLLEHAGGELIEPRLSRPLRRRVSREGQRIAQIPERFPLLHDEPQEPEQAVAVDAVSCVVPKTHARLEQAHSLWHEALNAYHDPEAFITKLNALLLALRSVTWVLRKEFGNSPEFKRWYGRWEAAMHADARMKWAVEARNKVEKQGDLEATSIAHVRIVAGGQSAVAAEMEVHPTADAAEIARRVQLLNLSESVRRYGIVEVERRWTLPELKGEELLDILAHCWGMLARVVADAHRQHDSEMLECEHALETSCGARDSPPHPSGRRSCMVASRELRTSRRILSTGVPYQLDIQPMRVPGNFDAEVAKERYRLDEWEPAPGLELPIRGRNFHEFARRVLSADGYHQPIAWLFRDGARVAQTVLHPEDHQDKAMMMRQLAVDADRMGANEFIFTTEAWEAPVVPDDDPRALLPAAEREDRREALITYAIARGDSCHVWHTTFQRNDDESIELAEPHYRAGGPEPFLKPLVDVWSDWPEGE